MNSAADLSEDPLKGDFRKFVYVVWKHLGLPDPTPIQYDIAWWLQHGPKRAVIQAFRGVGKSWITVAFVLWTLYCDPQKKIMVVSANAPKASEFSTFCLQLLRDMPLLRHLQPRADQRSSTISFDVGPAKPDQSPSVKSLGINGQLAGSRADIIVPDDIEIPKNSDTETKREILLEAVKEFDAVLKPLPTSRIVYLGTPQTEQSIYNKLPERGYIIRVWPSRYPTPEKAARYGARLAPKIAKLLAADPSLGINRAPTDPVRFDETELAERELSYGRSGYALQFQLDTSLSDADKYPLKLADLIVHPCDPYNAPIDFAWASSPSLSWKDLPVVGLQGDRYFMPMWWSPTVTLYEGTIMAVDPSGRGKDETSYAVVKLLHGRLFLVASGGFLGEGYSDEVLKSILMVAKKHDVKKIIAEPNFGGGMFVKLLQGAAQKHYACGVEDAEWSSTMKENRIVDTLEPVMNQHRLIVDPAVIQADYESTKKYDGDRSPEYRLFYQLPRMVKQKGALRHDDRLDALAMAVAYWTRHMARDTDKAVTDHHEAALNAELEKFMKGALGGQAQPERRWASKVARNANNNQRTH
jgi:hypothetical protein